LAYLGNRPAESYASFERQVFTIVNSQTAYTLSHSVTNENDIRLVVNNVVQEPGSGKAYTASGTTLTLSAALTNGTDEMYCVFLGRALQTVNPPNASVGSAQIADDLISGKTALGATPADTDELLISDAGTLKRVDYSYLKQSNTPAFQATLSSTQSISNSTATKVQFDSEIFDSDGTYDNSSNYRFTPAVAGKYHVTAKVNYADANADDKFEDVYIYKNGSQAHVHRTRTVGSTGRDKSTEVNAIVDLDADDYLEVFTQHNSGSSVNINGGSNQCLFQAFKLIT
tara:strand:+ start:1586 stop:2440 length:855 start_codon:yes stop_codon:yes gene_type:complete